ncbi:MAG: site-2 protease family protein [Candidatus Methanoperedens sp.]|nr:site-2 protease family protein [Candidatus Methanoperedens sp.]
MNNLHNKSGVDEELAEKINQFFSIYDIQHENGNIFFFGIPKEDIRIIYQKLWPVFTEKNYQLSVKYELGEHMLIASPFTPARERRWINVALAIATVITTMVMGSFLFGADPIGNPSGILKGIPFTIAIMAVLGSHEAGHYLIAKKHGMRTSLPYFIPFPLGIGTMGAVIKHRGPIPSRKALFDVGVSGPLIGLFVSIVVTIVGLFQPPVTQTSEFFQIQLSRPLLFEFITRFIPLNTALISYPIAFAGWVGMFVTALNLMPAGQLDGGHVLRAMLGEKARHVSTVMPFLLISLGFYVTYFQKSDGFLWVLWGLFLSFFAAAGHPKPLNDEVPLGKGRMALGILAFILGLLSLTLVPFQMQ